MKIKTTVTEIECTANELRQSGTVSDGLYNLLRGCINNLTSDCEDSEEHDGESESEDEEMTEQWQELKETITEMRDNDGTGTQQDACKFLANYMEVLEKQMQQPSEDCISREHAKQFLYYEIEHLHDDGLYDCFSRIIDDMYNELPPVTPRTNLAETSQDCISREAVKQAMYKICDDGGTLKENPWRDNPHIDVITDAIDNLPSVTPQFTDEEIDKAQAVEQAYVDKMVELAVKETERPKGKWIKCKSRFGTEYFKCSECGRKLDWIDRDDNYCNNCGSDNSESTKEWFKERDTKLAEMSGGKEDEASD